LLDLHLSHNIPDPAQVVPDIPPLLGDFIIKAGRCKPDERYQNVAEAIDDLKPLVIEFGLTHKNLPAEKKKMASLVLIYDDEQQKVLSELIDDFSNKVFHTNYSSFKFNILLASDLIMMSSCDIFRVSRVQQYCR
jgi:hypothetical protein